MHLEVSPLLFSLPNTYTHSAAKVYNSNPPSMQIVPNTQPQFSSNHLIALPSIHSYKNRATYQSIESVQRLSLHI